VVATNSFKRLDQFVKAARRKRKTRNRFDGDVPLCFQALKVILVPDFRRELRADIRNEGVPGSNPGVGSKKPSK
jgi:hypothetical protein